MTEPSGAGHRRRESYAERRERHGAIDDPTLVFDAGLRFLEARPRSIAEVRRRLGEAGYAPALIEGAVTRLLELGILDDEAFAAAWIASRDRAHPRGARALRAELLRKGIDAETIAAALEEREELAAPANDQIRANDDVVSADEAAARQLISRNRPALDRVADPRKRRQRAYALLARHGFDPDVASRMAGAALEGE